MNIEKKIARIHELARMQTASHLELANLLHQIIDCKLYQGTAYRTRLAFIVEELPFTVTTVDRYCLMHRTFTRLGYTHDEATVLVDECGWSKLIDVLPRQKRKLAVSTLKTKIREYAQKHQQINFTISERDKRRAERILKVFGMDDKHDRRANSSEAFLNLIEYHERLMQGKAA